MEASLLGRPHVFERGDRIYLTAPLVLASPTEQQVEEFAFASAVRTKAPNENIGWLQGRYVEAGRANLNGAMWLSDELAMKSLTPMLMPVTVMHDPRTAVGTIADCKLLQESAASRIDNILAIWRHRFPEIWEEAEHNIARGQMMQSMECFTPWYSCSECATTFVKLPNGAERASWCDHLRTNSGWRILGDVCFTGTGLIFGSHGGVGAYTDAHLDHFQAEVAEYHERAHVDANYKPTVRSASQMGLVQIEETELATLRRERDEAKRKSDELANDNRTLTTKAEQAEAAQKSAEKERDDERAAKTALEEKAQKTQLSQTRMNALGGGFLSKLGETSKARLTELASTCSDEQWDAELKEREELAKVKRDATPEGGSTPSGDNTPSNERSGFQSEEVARFMGATVASNNTGSGGGGGGGTPQDGATSVRQLARAFAPRKAANSGAKS